MALILSPAVRNLSLTLGLLAGALAPTAAKAQSSKAVKVDVPFAFQNGSQRLPAGAYWIGLESSHILAIRGEGHGGPSGFAMTNPNQKSTMPQTSKIVFTRLHGLYFLREVVLAGNATSTLCVKSRAEKQLQVAETTTDQPSGTQTALNVLP